MQSMGTGCRGANPGAARLLARAGLFASMMLLSCGSGLGDDGGDVCNPDDADGVIGGSNVFALTVDDTGFSPTILTAQNQASVTLTLHNAGTRPHDFVLDCIPTPNQNGCPATSCFDDDARIPAVEPGASATVAFTTPRPEGIYYYHSSIAGDATQPCVAGAMGCGQFIVK